ncbi:MAG: hypothetical protein ACRDX8_00305 [Acidimicrobiales bacterium]
MPPSAVKTMGLLIMGYATNGTVVTFLSGMNPAVQGTLTRCMPVGASYVLAGTSLYLGFATILGLVFAGILTNAA